MLSIANITRLIPLTLMSLSVFMPTQVLAQKQAAAATQEMEVVSVQGQRPLAYYAREYERAKFAMYEAYNEVNTEREFSIDCQIIKPIGTKIAKRECLPRFFRDESSNQAQLFMLGASNQLSTDGAQVAFLTKQKQKEFYQHIENISKDSPELLAHLHNISNKLEEFLVRKYDGKTP